MKANAKQTAGKRMLEAFFFARTGEDMPAGQCQPGTVLIDLLSLEQIAERLPARIVMLLEGIFDRIAEANHGATAVKGDGLAG